MLPSLDPSLQINIATIYLLNGRQKFREKGKRMTDEAKMNIVCDKLVGATTQAAFEEVDAQGRALLDLLYANLRAMLKIRNKWIKSRYADELYEAHRMRLMREYCK